MTNHYIDFLFRHPPAILWQIFLLTLARIIPVFALIPFLGSKLLAAPIKIGLSIALLLLCLPQILNEITHLPINDWHFYLLLVKEVFIGFFIGFIGAFPFYAIQSAGAFVSNQKGIQGMEGSTSPLSLEQTSPTGVLYHNVATIAFWFFGGPAILLRTLLISFHTWPLQQFLPAGFILSEAPLWKIIIKLAQLCLVLMIQLGAPSTIAMLLSDMFLGIINRMAPQVQVIYLLSALKAFMGTLFLCLAWWLIVKHIDSTMLSWMHQLEILVKKW
ncbi:Yop proteins translocation protein T [Candidatus Clavichlamydia salmonicola]|uniref:EscT/YscT/HrcT family type III secretion system export apparatus protein n=1 Tax=Candidatus Clavichlamydia salmonicola TaxID=469812 RepID=UPI001890F1A8|nr:EscT/YscT/HrcT family type III secretion system export apparatus protein [Candidatus Clavichlamydia salmonicola]MBF5050566.1 Yop proteins translocation protein T [Candidatus Clavichlamydia salmonicola]